MPIRIHFLFLQASFALLSLFISTFRCAQAAEKTELANIVDRGTHFEVTLNYETGATPRQVGEEYGKKIRQVVPQFEPLLDSYIHQYAGNKLIYKILMHRMRQIKPQIPKEYRDELDGIASELSGANKNIAGDGKISVDELYAFNLLGDIARMYQCSALAVFGDRSADRTTIVGRNFDWLDGKKNQLTQIQSVTTIKNGPKSIINIAGIGHIGAITAFNRSHIYAAVLDSPTGNRYSAAKKHSYVLDLRKALEDNTSIASVADFMKDSKKKYAFNHLIMFADPKTAVVLENDISGKSTDIRRAIRTCDSTLRNNTSWTVNNSIGSVNCFELEGNIDNHIDPQDLKSSKAKRQSPADVNTPRWNTLQTQLIKHGPKITGTDMENILSYHRDQELGNIYTGDLYNSFTIQSIVFEPAGFNLDIAFRPRDGHLPPQLKFEHIPVSLDSTIEAAPPQTDH